MNNGYKFVFAFLVLWIHQGCVSEKSLGNVHGLKLRDEQEVLRVTKEYGHTAVCIHDDRNTNLRVTATETTTTHKRTRPVYEKLDQVEITEKSFNFQCLLTPLIPVQAVGATGITSIYALTAIPRAAGFLSMIYGIPIILYEGLAYLIPVPEGMSERDASPPFCFFWAADCFYILDKETIQKHHFTTENIPIVFCYAVGEVAKTTFNLSWAEKCFSLIDKDTRIVKKPLDGVLYDTWVSYSDVDRKDIPIQKISISGPDIETLEFQGIGLSHVDIDIGEISKAISYNNTLSINLSIIIPQKRMTDHLSFDVSTLRGRIPPKIVFNKINKEIVKSPTTLLTYTIQGDTTLANIEVFIDDNLLFNSDNSEEELALFHTGHLKLSLKSGENRIKVVAHDKAGLLKIETITLIHSD